MNERPAIWQIADQIQMDLRAAQAKMVELRAHLSSLDLKGKEPTLCPSCGISLRGPVTLSEHLYQFHDGPLPEHWARVDAISQEAA